jgi:hypothetical protein
MGVKRECNKRRNNHRKRNNKAEFPKQAARKPCKNITGRKTAANATVVDTTAKRFLWRLSVPPPSVVSGFYFTVDIFQYYNRIIHHQSDGQNYTEQG